MKREEVLQAMEGSPESFLQLLRNRNEGDFDLGEFLQALPRKQQSRAWAALLPLASGVAERLLEQDGERGREEREKEGGCEDMEVMRGVVTLCKCALSLENLNFTSEFSETLQIIHDILLSVPEEWCDVQNVMSEVCELCWVRDEDVEDREQLVPNCLLYLVARTFSQGATVKDVGRVWAMRGALLLLDFEDSSADSIKELLLSALIEPLYLTSVDGKKILTYLFGLHPAFMESLHQAIRNQITWCPKAYLDIYGEIYFRSWRLASGLYLKKIEEYCIQDLMYMAVHADRTGPRAVFPALRKLLGCIHQQTHHNGVSEMILRLYNPFLWRSLKVANAHVRANAVCLMLDAFPLHDPSSTREEIDTLLQRQFDLMAELMFDDSPMVRSLAVLGVSRALCRYWEMIPLTVVKSLLHKMIRELAYDTSSDNVRVAVLQGLSIILETRLSHSLLRDLLPLLHTHIHDTSVKVRIAFLDMLLVVRGIRSIKFFDVCSVEDLLARMDGDSVHVVKRIVSLLVSSFQPSTVPLTEQVARCLTLVELNTVAARRFYQLVVTHLPPSHVVRFMLALWTVVRQAAESVEGEEEENEIPKNEEETAENNKTKSENRKKDGFKNHASKKVEESGDLSESGDSGEEVVEGDPGGIAEGGWREREKDGDTSKREAPSLSDTDLLAGALEVMAILWEGLSETLSDPKHKQLNARLTSAVTKSLPLLFNTLTDGRCRSALYFLAAHLPKRSVAGIVRGTIETISSLEQSSKDYAAMVTAMTSWKQTGEVLTLISQWLKTSLEAALPRPSDEVGDEVRGQEVNSLALTNRQRRTRGRGKKAVMTEASTGTNLTTGPKPHLGLNILNYMLLHPVCREEIKRQKELWDLETSLHQSLTVIDSHFSGATPTNLNFDLLQEMLSVYMRLALHRAVVKGGGCDVVRMRVRQIVDWSEKCLLPVLRGDMLAGAKQPAKRHSNRKRKADQSHLTLLNSDLRVKEGCQVTETLLGATTEAVVVGLADGELQLELAQWAASVAKTASGPLLLRPLVKLMYQLSEASVLSELEGIRTVTTLEPTAILLQPLLQIALSASSSSSEDFKKVWSVLKGGVVQVVAVSLRLHSVSFSPHTVPTFTTLTSVIMDLLIHEVKENPTRQTALLKSLPPLLSALLDIVSHNDSTARVFLFHLHLWLDEEEQERDNVPLHLLRHLAALHPLSLLASNAKGLEELMRCVHSSLRFAEKAKDLPETAEGQLSEDVDFLSQCLEAIQDQLHSI